MVVGLIPSPALSTILRYQALGDLESTRISGHRFETLNFPEIRLTVLLMFTFRFHHNSFSSDNWRLSVGFESHSFE